MKVARYRIGETSFAELRLPPYSTSLENYSLRERDNAPNLPHGFSFGLDKRKLAKEYIATTERAMTGILGSS